MAMRLTRRGFIGALTAIVAAPRALFAREPMTTLGLSGDGTYCYTYSFYNGGGKTTSGPVTLSSIPVGPTASTHYRLYRYMPDGSVKVIAERWN